MARSQEIPGDDAKIKEVQSDNHTKGKCFKPWVVRNEFTEEFTEEFT